MDFSGVIDGMGNASLSITRRGLPTLGVNGVYIAASTTPLTVDGVVYPARPRDVLVLAEGRRSERAVVLLTKSALQGPTAPGNGVGGLQGDLLSYQGETFEILHTEPWTEHGFYRSVAVKAGQ